MSANDKQRLIDLEKRVDQLEKLVNGGATAATPAIKTAPPRPAIPGQKRPPVMVPVKPAAPPTPAPAPQAATPSPAEPPTP